MAKWFSDKRVSLNFCVLVQMIVVGRVDKNKLKKSLSIGY